MKRFSKNRWVQKILGWIRFFRELEIPLHAANACFFISLSAFPALALTSGLLRYSGLEIGALEELLGGIVPAALMPTVQVLIEDTWDNATGALVGLSALTTLWSAGRGIYALMTGLDAVCGLREDRGYFRKRLVCTVYTVLFLLMMLLTLALHVFWPKGRVLRLGALLAAQVLMFTLVYMFLPCRRGSFRGSLPGAVLAGLGWTAFAWGFSVYVVHFSDTSGIYGPVYTLALAMLWLYFCMGILLFGGAVNRLLEKKR